MKRRTKIWGITLSVLFWCASLLLPIYTGLLSLFIVLFFFLFWLGHVFNNYRYKRYFKYQILFSPLIALFIYGTGLGLVSYLTGYGGFFFLHTSYYDKTTESINNNLDPEYRVYHIDHRGNYYGPILFYSWGTVYYYFFNDITLISLVKIFGYPPNNYAGPMPTFEELKQINSFKLDTIPVIDNKERDFVMGKIFINNKIVVIKKQHEMQQNQLHLCNLDIIDSLRSIGIPVEQQDLKTVAYTKYYPLIIIPFPYMSEAPHDFGGKIFMYDCLYEKYVAEILIPDSAYYNAYCR